ncbi:MAG: transporter [Rhizobiales bacterium 35-68-8]|nr:MAG: transporter [Rhizobiales bacterium 35-68-8]
MLILTALVPVALIVALGYGLRRTLLKEASHWFAMEQLTYFVLFPALLTVSAARADLSRVSFSGVVGAYGLTLTILFLLLIAARPLLARTLGVSGPAFTSVAQGVLRWNSYLALAVASGLYGAEGVTVAAVALASLVPFVNIMVVWLLARHASTRPPGMGTVLRQLARNPLILSCAAGMTINMLSLPVPAVVMEFGDILGRASLALGIMVVGAGLSLRGLARPKPEALLAVILDLLVKPAMTLGIGLWFGLSGVELVTITLLSAVPSAPAGYVLARQMGGDAPLLAQILTLQILASAVTLPLVAYAAQAVAA